MSKGREILLVLAGASLAGAVCAAQTGPGVELTSLGDGLVAAPVVVAGERLDMLVDTGASRSLLRAVVAERLGLRPRARFDLHTPTAVVQAVCAGPVAARLGGESLSIDCLGWSRELGDAAFAAGVDGVLGMDAMRGVPLRIDVPRRHLIVGAAALRVIGSEVPLVLAEGRPALVLRARTGGWRGRDLRLVVDSGTSELILFGSAGAVGGKGVVHLETLDGHHPVRTAPAPRLGLQRPVRRALLLPGVTDRAEDGLLPLAALGPVAFDWRRSVAILGGRTRRGQ